MLEGLKRYAAAADIHIFHGNILKAISLLDRAGDGHSRQRATNFLIDGLWKALPLGVCPSDSDEDTMFAKLVSVAENRLTDKLLVADVRKEVTGNWLLLAMRILIA